jgi:inward rectifier potassium channel
MFSNTVAIRTSYTFNELVYGAKFEPMFTRVPIILNNPKFRSVERLQKGFLP